MDSLTQLTLGAAVGEAVLGRRVGRRAALWGAICGTLPDLDVVIPMGSAVADFTYHRSFSHSLFVLAALTPLLAWLAARAHPGTATRARDWVLMVYAVFATHVFLDCLTVYGTQIFWPLSDHPVSIGSVFIIDPVYTLPLLLGLIATLTWYRRGWAPRANRIGLGVSTAYLVFGLAAQWHVERLAVDAFARQGIAYERILTQPTPFNGLLWRIVAVAGDRYHVGYRSLLDEGATIATRNYPYDPSLLTGIEDHWPVRRLQWFTHGFYSVEQIEDRVVMSDLRMGLEPDRYAFRFEVARIGNPHAKSMTSTRIPAERGWELLPLVFRRIVDPEVDFSDVRAE